MALGHPALAGQETDVMVLAGQSSQARDENLLGKLPFQELFAKSAVQFFSFKVTMCWEGTTWVKGILFWFFFGFFLSQASHLNN